MIIGISMDCKSALSGYKNEEQINLSERKIQADTVPKKYFTPDDYLEIIENPEKRGRIQKRNNK